MRNLYVPLPEGAIERLRELAAREFRGTKEQATVLIIDGLRRSGLPIDENDRRPLAPAERGSQ